MLIKRDSRRRIDRVLDYFGEERSAQDADRERRLDDHLVRHPYPVAASARPTAAARPDPRVEQTPRGASVPPITSGKAPPPQPLAGRRRVHLPAVLPPAPAREKAEP